MGRRGRTILFAAAAVAILALTAAPASAAVEAVVPNDANLMKLVKQAESCAKKDEKAHECLDSAHKIYNSCTGVHMGDNNHKMGCQMMAAQNLLSCINLCK